VDPLPTELVAKYRFLRVTNRKSIVYDRKDQVVAREIIIFKYGKEELSEASNSKPEVAEDEPSQ